MNQNELIIVNIDKSFNFAVDKAAEIYFRGGTFVYPTDTIYGLGGDPFQVGAKKRIEAAKNREDDKKFVCLIDSLELLERYAAGLSVKQLAFLNKVWPAPLTAVVSLKEEYRADFNSSTVAFRIPNESFCRELLKKIKTPLISTSVNKSGSVPINDPYKIFQDFKNEIDGLFFYEKSGQTNSSTIVKLLGDNIELIREGAVSFERIIEISEYN